MDSNGVHQLFFYKKRLSRQKSEVKVYKSPSSHQKLFDGLRSLVKNSSDTNSERIKNC